MARYFEIGIDLVGAGATVVAAWFAWKVWQTAEKAWRTAENAQATADAALTIGQGAFYRDHRPIVRVVPLFEEKTPGHGAKPEDMHMDRVLLKNIGRGPALPLFVYDPDHDRVLGDAEAVEPLGDGDVESKRLGRLTLTLPPMAMEKPYELYYQDILADWHVTRFRPTPWKIRCSFARVEPDKVPGTIAVLATVARP